MRRSFSSRAFSGMRVKLNRWQRLMIVGRTLWGSVVAKKNFTVSRGLFERFEQSIEGLFCEHVHFVDDVNFIVARCWGIADGFIDLADVVDPSVGGAIDFDYIQACALRNFYAADAGISKVLEPSVRLSAV